MEDEKKIYIGNGCYIEGTNLCNDDKEEHLTQKELGILTYLAINKNLFLSRTQIIDCVWDYPCAPKEPEKEQKLLNPHITHIQKKLKKMGLEGKLVNNTGYGTYKLIIDDSPVNNWPDDHNINKSKDDNGDSKSANENPEHKVTSQEADVFQERGIDTQADDNGDSEAVNEISGNNSESLKENDSHKEGIDRDAYDKSDSEQADEIPEIKAASLNKGDSSEKENQPGGQDGGDGGGKRPPNYLNIAIIIGFVLTLAIITIYVLIVRENDATENTTLPSATNNESLDSSKDDLINGQISYIMDESGNDRFSYTNNQIDSGILGDTITFNSISDGKFGDEKFFVSAKAANDEVAVWNNHTINVQDGETYTIRMYVHNDNPNGEAARAENVKARFNVPNTISRTVVVTGYLESSNAIPMNYFDSVILTSDDYFRIEYIDGSASYTNTAMGTIPISDSVKSFGIPLGYKKFDGMIPGGYEFDGFVTIAVTVHKSVPTQTEVKARIKGTKGWNDEIWANVGDEIEFQIEYVNYHDYDVRNVMVRDKLPTNIQYVEETTYLYNINHQDGALLLDEKVTTDGINIGTYGPESNAYVRFTGKVVDVSLVNGLNKLVNWAGITESGRVFKDDVVVWVNFTK